MVIPPMWADQHRPHELNVVIAFFQYRRPAAGCIRFAGFPNFSGPLLGAAWLPDRTPDHQAAIGSMPLRLIAAAARGEARNAISRLACAVTVEPATTAAAKTCII